MGLKDGLRIVGPDEALAKSYLGEAKSSLKRAEKDLEDGDLLWSTVVIYYSEYYALYSFLQRIGIKCENHFCSILAAEKLLGSVRVRTINEHKGKRIDAQYYMRTGREEQVRQMLKEAKAFVSGFEDFVSNLTDREAQSYMEKFKSMVR
jgi:uncharacterized protein (UPF0332 family)